MSDRIDAATNYIATHQPETLARDPRDPPDAPGPRQVAEDVRRIKPQAAPDLILSGSSMLNRRCSSTDQPKKCCLSSTWSCSAKQRFFAEHPPAPST